MNRFTVFVMGALSGTGLTAFAATLATTEKSPVTGSVALCFLTIAVVSAIACAVGCTS